VVPILLSSIRPSKLMTTHLMAPSGYLVYSIIL
jgi:hypothetical protein